MSIVLDFEREIESNGVTYVLREGMKFISNSDSKHFFIIDSIYRSASREVALALRLTSGSTSDLLVRDIRISDLKLIFQNDSHTLDESVEEVEE